MQNYDVEITDTFSGEANYAWVRRLKVKARSMRGAISIVARRTGFRFRLAYDDGVSRRYNVPGACICAFVNRAWE